MFRTVPLSTIRSFSLYTQQWYILYSLRAGSGPNSSWSSSQAVSKPVWHIPLLCVQWKTLDDVQRNCPKHVEFYSKNKFEKLVHLVCFIIRIYPYFTRPMFHYRIHKSDYNDYPEREDFSHSRSSRLGLTPEPGNGLDYGSEDRRIMVQFIPDVKRFLSSEASRSPWGICILLLTQ
jgi:hypothetical protein